MTCRDHVKDEATKDLFEYDETVAFDTKAQYVGRIGKIDEKDPVELKLYQGNMLSLSICFDQRHRRKCPQDERLTMRSTLRKD